MPWARQKLKSRSERRLAARVSTGLSVSRVGVERTSGDVELERVPSSTSVFHTPSSVVRESASIRSRISLSRAGD